MKGCERCEWYADCDECTFCHEHCKCHEPTTLKDVGWALLVGPFLALIVPIVIFDDWIQTRRARARQHR